MLIKLQPEHTHLLYSLFDEIIDTGAFDFFHPHPFTLEQAKQICNHTGKDLYLASIDNGQISSYGLLRGWDEGYDIPSLGIYVAEKYRGTGLSKKTMEELHGFAWKNGVKKIRLTVLHRNKKALALYQNLGYTLYKKYHDHVVFFLSNSLLKL